MKKSIFILFVLLIWGCEKIEQHSPIPEIELIGFDAAYKYDSDLEIDILYGELTFYFIDGDGNIGFAENSDSINFNEIPDIIIKELKPNGEIIKDTLGPYYLPYFNESSYKKSLKGEIQVNLMRLAGSADTVYYEFYIKDRNNNESNLITTPVYIYSELAKQ